MKPLECPPLILICPTTGDWIEAESTNDPCPHADPDCEPVFYGRITTPESKEGNE